MRKTILVTGSRGLIGRYLIPLLEVEGYSVREFDRQHELNPLDLCETSNFVEALDGVRGVVHLGAVSRVVWGQLAPELCIQTNTTATARLIDHCLFSSGSYRPWVIYASSREVYGEAAVLPVREDALLQPMNVYARSKKDSEEHCLAARDNGLIANVVRLSSVYGCPRDHADRVVPAFARAAAFGGVIRLEGRENVLDFTFVDDVVGAIATLVARTDEGSNLPPIHLVSGKGTRLGDLAELAHLYARQPIEVVEAAPRTYDVSHFVGDPSRAEKILGWKSSTSLEVGFQMLIERLLATEVGGDVLANIS